MLFDLECEEDLICQILQYFSFRDLARLRATSSQAEIRLSRLPGLFLQLHLNIHIKFRLRKNKRPCSVGDIFLISSKDTPRWGQPKPPSALFTVSFFSDDKCANELQLLEELSDAVSLYRRRSRSFVVLLKNRQDFDSQIRLLARKFHNISFQRIRCDGFGRRHSATALAFLEGLGEGARVEYCELTLTSRIISEGQLAAALTALNVSSEIGRAHV